MYSFHSVTSIALRFSAIPNTGLGSEVIVNDISLELYPDRFSDVPDDETAEIEIYPPPVQANGHNLVLF
jgi:hypothetical protein